MRFVVLVGLVACGAPRAPAPVATTAPATTAPVQRDLAVAEPWNPPPDPAESFDRPLRLSPGSREKIILMREGRYEPRQQLAEKRSDLWDPCVRDVLADRDVEVRNALGDALASYAVTCDRTSRRIAFEPPAAKGAQGGEIVVGLHGVLTGTRTEVALRVAYWVERADPFERITILAGPLRWTSPRLDVEQYLHQEVASIPFAPSLARVVRRMLDEPDARIRFVTTGDYAEHIITDQNKQEIRVLLDALDL